MGIRDSLHHEYRGVVWRRPRASGVLKSQLPGSSSRGQRPCQMLWTLNKQRCIAAEETADRIGNGDGIRTRIGAQNMGQTQSGVGSVTQRQTILLPLVGQGFHPVSGDMEGDSRPGGYRLVYRLPNNARRIGDGFENLFAHRVV